MSKCPMGLASICWPHRADYTAHEWPTNNRVKPLWLKLTIHWLRAHYWSADKRARWLAAHR
ncbi:MAG: hypothetical protein ACYCQM_04710 [Acidithiobacillus sp.]